ncbi:uncharacterized protein sS8_4890 [Methylocaldum marinum]|uniref:DUF1643 domain-containing protein n=1 Tax=Methylocaldum marinum TaxID=1432792 RepID=A0A250KYQ7_9GAMM|nr:DUF1643 domain-containing protein [Methylocaldum marinum]BBA36813.1 uncharacterized protein sS8_4890 [Methylocaldum marinum]
MEKSADLSGCGRYRYALRRRWSGGDQVLFVMLNPSTADAEKDDPTIRRCIAFAQEWDFGALAVGNLFAFRTPSPRGLRAAADPVGPHNDRELVRLQAESKLVVAAWGNYGGFLQRDAAVRALLSGLHILGLTKQDQPRHPLYVPAETQPRAWD